MTSYHCSEQLLALLPKAVDIRKVLGKSYAFVEFDSFPSADFVCKQSVHTPYVLGGKNLTIGWGKTLDEVEALAGEDDVDTNREKEEGRDTLTYEESETHKDK